MTASTTELALFWAGKSGSNEQKRPYVAAFPQLCVQPKTELAVGTFLPLLNQLISLSCCQEGVRLQGLGVTADLGVVMPKPEIQGSASLPERKADTPPTPCKNKILHHDQTPASPTS